MTFDDFDLLPDLADALYEMGFDEPTPVQEQGIPIIMEGHDLMAFAQTGTGKTAAFLVPIINQILSQRKATGVKAMIIAPTRELAQQIEQQLQGFAYYANLSSIAIYGGGDGSGWDYEKKALTQGADFIVATPGRLISHLNLGYVDLKSLEYFILDEADKMLDMGFLPDITSIINKLPEKRQNMMFSATMNPKIKILARKILTDPKEVSIAIAKPAEKIVQAAYLVHENQKIDLLEKLLENKVDNKLIIFSSKKITVNEIVKRLQAKKIKAKGIHSGFEQNEREQILLDFRNGKQKVLIATDIVSRGIDIDDIDLIINFDIPAEAEDYVHRVGRTARAEREGLAISLINQDDVFRFKKIEKLIEKEIFKIPLPEGFETGPEFKTSKYKDSGKPKKFSKFKKKPPKK
ncbi:MAG: DEAD/DEAH box helicase [Bacteroidales bacterium]|nr:DEAD/DEAH box helicase [Bacteroidales bacterium]